MNKEIEKIKSRGFWRINFRPLLFKKDLISLTKCKEVVKNNTVQIRGWNYPHFPSSASIENKTSNLTCGQNYYNGLVNWGDHKESWFMYQSGQFLHYVAVREDWPDESNFPSAPYKPFEIGTNLEIINVQYLITEIFEFLSRLTNHGLYGDGAEVSITLGNTLNRILCLRDLNKRVPLSNTYKTDLSSITFERVFSKNEILSKTNEMAFYTLSYFFERFKWETLPMWLKDEMLLRYWQK